MSAKQFGIRKGEHRSSSRQIAFYIVLEYQSPASMDVRDTHDADFETDTTGRVFAKPVYGNMIQLDLAITSFYASSRGAIGHIFLNKSTIEARLGVRFAS